MVVKSKLKKANNLLTVPPVADEFATLLGVTNKSFLYRFTYTVDHAEALRKRCSLVNILVYKEPERPPKNSFVKQWQEDPVRSLEDFRVRGSLAKDAAREKKQGDNLVVRWVSDFTSRVSNSDTRAISRKQGVDSGDVSVSRPKIKNRDKTVVTTAKAVNRTGTKVPVFETNIHKPSEFGDVNLQNSVEVARVSTTLLWRHRRDPAEVAGTKTNNVVPAKRVLGGLTSNPSSGGGGRRRTSFLSPAQVATVLDTVVNPVNISDPLDLDPDDIMVVPTTDDHEFLTVHEKVEIPVGSVPNSEFFVVLELVDKDEVTMQQVERVVAHEQNLKRLDLVTKPPLVKIQPAPSPNRNVLHITQRDTGAVGVNVYRRENKPHLPTLDSEYQFVEKVEVGMSPVVFVDEVPNQNPVSYRVVPFDAAGVLSGEFTGVVSPSVRGKGATGRNLVETRVRFCSLIPEVEESGVSVLVRSVPGEVVALQLLRQDLTAHQTRWSKVGDVVQVPGATGAPLVLVDQTVKPNRVYLYTVLFVYRDGSETESSSVAFVENTPVIANLVTTTLTVPTVTRSENEIDIEFQMKTELVPTNMDLVNQAIKNQDLLLYFREDIESRRKDLQGIVCYQVVRRDLTTGEVEAFTPSVNRTFSDRQYGPLNNVSPLVPGHEYDYLVHTWFRNTETMLQDLERDVETTSGNLTRTHTLTPSKWWHPVTLRDGNLVSETSVVRNYGTTEFQLGTLGAVTKTPVMTFADELPSVTEATASRFTPRSVFVSWTTQGVTKKFDHFLVTAMVHGMKSVVGKVHNISDSNRFHIVDEREVGDHTTLTYEVVPVYYNQVRGQPVLTNKVSI